jgi:hypothetical protein
VQAAQVVSRLARSSAAVWVEAERGGQVDQDERDRAAGSKKHNLYRKEGRTM